MDKPLRLDSDRVAIFTDLHLGVHQNSSTWHNISKQWSTWFIQDLKDKDIDTIFFTGDFFHSRSEISVSTIQAASDLLSQFNSDFKIYMIPGNHDCYYKDKSDVNSLSILNGYNNINVFNNVSYIQTTNGKCFAFCPWGFSYEDIKPVDIIFGHFEIESFKMNAHKLCEHGFKPKDLLKKSPLVFSGHFHLNEEREYDDGKIVYVGSPFQLDFGERDSKKGYYILDTNNLYYTFVENQTTPVHKKILLSEIVNTPIENIKSNFVKLVLDVHLDQEKLDTIVRQINEKSPLSLTIDPLINYSINYTGDNDQDLSGIDISKAIVEFVGMLDVDNKEQIIKKTIELYTQIK